MRRKTVFAAMMVMVTAGMVAMMSIVPAVAQSTPSASRSFDSAAVDPGGQVVVTINASNYGQAGGVTETLPAGFSYVSSSLDSSQVTELPNNQVRFTLQGDTSFTYTVTASTSPGSHTFSGTLRDSDRSDHAVGGATSITVNTPPAGPTPSASRSFDSAAVDPGGQVVVTINASNYGQAGGITETLPAGFSYVSSSLDSSQVTELPNNQVRFTLQGDTSFTYTVTASTSPGSHTFSGTLRDSDRSDHAVGGATSITVNTPPAGPTPSASRSFDSAAVDPGGQVVVTINASNYGQAGGITETLPAGFSYVSSSLMSASQVTELPNNEVRFTLQGDTSFTYTVTASSTPGPYTFSGTLRDDDRNDHTVSGATEITVKGPNAMRSFSSPSVRPGARVTVTMRASNYGQAGGVTETLPSGFSYVSSSLDAVQVTDLGNDQIRFTLQGDTSFTYTVTASSRIGTYTFSGTLRDEDRTDHIVGGPSSIRVRTPSTGGGGGGGTTPPANLAPAFDEGPSASRSVAEHSAPGTAVGSPVTATDPDRDSIAYSLDGVDASLFAIDSSSGQITVGEGTTLDFETTESYSVRVEARDPSGARDSIDITISVSNVNEPGMLTISSTEPAFGVDLTATLEDPDGGVTGESWQWQGSSEGTTWTDISGATEKSYTPSHSDGGLMLRATVEYSDAAGSASLESEATQALPPAPTPPTPVPTQALHHRRLYLHRRRQRLYLHRRRQRLYLHRYRQRLRLHRCRQRLRLHRCRQRLRLHRYRQRLRPHLCYLKKKANSRCCWSLVS